MRRESILEANYKAPLIKLKLLMVALREAVELGHNRNSWLIFSSGIEHAEHIAAMLTSFWY